MPIVDQQRFEEIAARLRWAGEQARLITEDEMMLHDLHVTVRALWKERDELREALGTMLEIEGWTYVDGNVERAKERCRAIWEKAGGESDVT